METFRISNLTFTYPNCDHPTLNSLSLTIQQGDFITLCGSSGSGKSTLLRHLKTVLTPHGERSGQILFYGLPLQDVDSRTQASKIGFVLQSPENQIVTDKVWHELAFGLENLGTDPQVIRLRVAEMASFFGIQTWFHRDVSELSGGQKQILNLAAIMAMQPSMLILDEPTSQLDPIAAAEFIDTLKKINTELGTTILLSEQRLEEVFPLSDRILVLDHGHLIADGSPSEVGDILWKLGHPMFRSMPTPIQVYAQVGGRACCPITVRDGRRWLGEVLQASQSPKDTVAWKAGEPDSLPSKDITPKRTSDNSTFAIELKDVWFRYAKNLTDVIKGLSITIPRQALTCILGGNGTGKTTALALMAGLHKPYRGKVTRAGSIAMLPQNPQVLFVEKTVELDLLEVLSDTKLTLQQKEDGIRRISELTDLTALLRMHPYDLSGGEQQRAALAKVLLRNPEVLLLDEPTKGMDAAFKERFARLLQDLIANGTTVIMVSHDIEFCARYGDLCAMFFDGNVTAVNPPRVFFSGNSFYTTAANRMSRQFNPETVTIEDVIALCQTSGH